MYTQRSIRKLGLFSGPQNFPKCTNKSVNHKFKYFTISWPQIWNLLNISIIKPTFLIGNWKIIKFFKTSLNNKNSISFSHIKFFLTSIFAQKMMELWSFFQFCFWGPLKLLRPLKKAQILDYWPLTMPLKTRHWMRLVSKKCPVSTVLHTTYLHSTTNNSQQWSECNARNSWFTFKNTIQSNQVACQGRQSKWFQKSIQLQP